MRRRVSLVAALASATVLISIGSIDRHLSAAGMAELPRDAQTNTFSAAWRLSRGERVTVAVVSTEAAVAKLVQSLAPASVVIHESPGSDERHSRLRPETDRLADAALARSIDSLLAKGPRVLLVALAGRGEYTRAVEALARADSLGVLVVAPSGDEGLSQDRFPASLPGVLAVASLTPADRLAETANAGPRTTVAARAPSSFEAAAQVAAAAALAFAFDPRVTSVEVRRALEAGEIAKHVRPRPGEVAALDPASVLERLRPRGRAVVLRDARVLPFDVPEGEPATLRVRVVSVGRLPARGFVIATLPGGHEVRALYGPLAPGLEREVVLEITPRGKGARAPVTTADGGQVAASPSAVTLCAGSASSIVSFSVVPSYQRPPALRIVRVAASPALHVAVTVENAGTDPDRTASVRLTRKSGRVIAEASIPVLAPGDRSTLDLDASHGTEPDGLAGVVELGLDLVRRPAGFRETTEERWTLAVDPRAAVVTRGGARR